MQVEIERRALDDDPAGQIKEEGGRKSGGVDRPDSTGEDIASWAIDGPTRGEVPTVCGNRTADEVPAMTAARQSSNEQVPLSSGGSCAIISMQSCGSMTDIEEWSLDVTGDRAVATPWPVKPTSKAAIKASRRCRRYIDTNLRSPAC